MTKNGNTTNKPNHTQDKPINTDSSDNTKQKYNYAIPDTFSRVVGDSQNQQNIIRKTKK